MLRNVLILVAGLVAGFAAISAIQTLNYLLFSLPAGLDYNKPEDLVSIMEQIPAGALLILELSYAVGSLAAGAVIGRFGRDRTTLFALIAGAILTAANLVNLQSIPTPLWLAVLTTVTFVPGTWIGAKPAARRENRWIANRLGLCTYEAGLMQ